MLLFFSKLIDFYVSIGWLKLKLIWIVGCRYICYHYKRVRMCQIELFLIINKLLTFVKLTLWLFRRPLTIWSHGIIRYCSGLPFVIVDTVIHALFIPALLQVFCPLTYIVQSTIVLNLYSVEQNWVKWLLTVLLWSICYFWLK